MNRLVTTIAGLAKLNSELLLASEWYAALLYFHAIAADMPVFRQHFELAAVHRDDCDDDDDDDDDDDYYEFADTPEWADELGRQMYPEDAEQPADDDFDVPEERPVLTPASSTMTILEHLSAQGEGEDEELDLDEECEYSFINVSAGSSSTIITDADDMVSSPPRVTRPKLMGDFHCRVLSSPHALSLLGSTRLRRKRSNRQRLHRKRSRMTGRSALLPLGSYSTVHFASRHRMRLARRVAAMSSVHRESPLLFARSLGASTDYRFSTGASAPRLT